MKLPSSVFFKSRRPIDLSKWKKILYCVKNITKSSMSMNEVIRMISRVRGPKMKIIRTLKIPTNTKVINKKWMPKNGAKSNS